MRVFLRRAVLFVASSTAACDAVSGWLGVDGDERLDCEAACAAVPTSCRDGQLYVCEGMDECTQTPTTCAWGYCFDDRQCGAITSFQWGSARSDSLVSIAVDEDDRLWFAGASEGHVESTGGSFSEGLYVFVAGLDGKVIHIEQFGKSTVGYRERAVALQLKAGGGAYLLSYNPAHRQYRVDATLVREFESDGRIRHTHEFDPSSWTTDFAVLGPSRGLSQVDGLFIVGRDEYGQGLVDASLIGELAGKRWYDTLQDVGTLAAIAPVAADGIVVVGDTGRDEADDRVELFAARYTRDGTLQWQTRWGGDGRSRPADVAVDPEDGSIYVVGETDGRIGAAALGGRDWFLSKLDPRGSVQWSRQWGTRGWDVPSALVSAAGGRVIAVGQIASEHAPHGFGGADAWLVEADAAGEVRRSSIWGSPDDDMASSVALTSDGRIVVAGTTHGSLGGAAQGSADVFVSVVGPGSTDPTDVGAPRGHTVPAVVPVSDAGPPEAPSSGLAVRPFVVFRPAGPRRGRVLQPVGERLEELPIVVNLARSGTVGIGSSAPTLSPDGRWLARIEGDVFVVGRLDGSVVHRPIADPSPLDAVLFCGFSPNSTHLLFHRDEIYDEESDAGPGKHPIGFYLFDLDAGAFRPIPELASFTTWSADPNRVFLEGQRNGDAALLSFDFETRRERVVQTFDAYSSIQLSLVGRFMAYNWGGPPGSSTGVSQIFTSRIDGAMRRARTPSAEWASIQRPALSPDTRHLAYCDDGDLTIVELGTGRRVKRDTCSGDSAWISPTELLVLDGPVLRRIGLEARDDVVARGVAGFAVGGVEP